MFIERRELPGLVWGVASARADALRRILGARRAGRYGGLLAGVGLGLAAPDAAAALACALLHGAGALASGLIARDRPVARERLRLSLWTGGLGLLALSPLRALAPASAVPALAGTLLGQVLLWRALHRGLGPRDDAPEEDAGE